MWRWRIWWLCLFSKPAVISNVCVIDRFEPPRLKDVKDIEQIGPDSQTIKGRLQVLCTATAENIKKCANTCDTYSKKKVVVKIFAGPIWEGKLVEFVGLFTKRRQEYELVDHEF